MEGTSQTQQWAGLDVAKQSFVAALYMPCAANHARPVLRDLPRKACPRTKAGVRSFLNWAKRLLAESEDTVLCVVMEATGRYSTELQAWLVELEPSLPVVIVNPQAVSHYGKSLLLRNKNDELDAAVLAFYGQERQPKPQEELPAAYKRLRELERQYAHFMKHHTAAKTRQQEIKDLAEIAALHAPIVKALKDALANAKAIIVDLLLSEEELATAAKLLRTIPGVGMMTIAIVLGESGPLERFTRSRQLSAFSGLSPHQKQSGTSILSGGTITRKGSSRLRQALYMATLTAMNCNPQIEATRERLIAKGKKPMVARCALMRKLLVLMRAIVVSGQAFDPAYIKQKTAA